MAVIQISKIQVRRGLQEDLPQLASGEFGWSIDTQRLYIGNGALTEGAPQEGNTEIVTSGRDILSIIRSYTFKGTESGYTSQTGPSLLDPIKRSFQEKLDDHISARDFGAIGDGVTDDTVALQRAIDQVFPKDYYITVGVRRKLHIPAGTYILSGNLRLPPYAHVEGDGPRSTIIKQTSGGPDTVLQLKDSKGNVGAQINTTTSDAPFQITVKNLTLQTTESSNVAVVDSGQIVTFDGVRFQGPRTTPVTTNPNTSGVKILDSAATSQNIVFNRCEFARTTYGIKLEGNIRSVTVNDSWFDTLYQAVNASANVGSPQSVKVISSMFDNIAAQAVYSDDDSSVTTAHNFYANVGTTDSANLVTATAAYPVLAWNTANNYSIGDIFTRTSAQQSQYSLIEILNEDQTASLTQGITQGSVTDQPGGTISLAANTAANLGVVLTSVTPSAIVDYRIQRDNDFRIGTVKVTHYGGTVVYEDDYSETANIGVSLSFVGNATAGTATLRQVSSAGSNSAMKYTIRSFV